MRSCFNHKKAEKKMSEEMAAGSAVIPLFNAELTR
jgi:hypothetical protein